MAQNLWALLIEKCSLCVWIWVLSIGGHPLGYAFTEDDQNKDAESENLDTLRISESAECVEAWEKKDEEKSLRVVYRKMKPRSSGLEQQ